MTKVKLYECNGEVISIDKFVREYIASTTLTDYEKQILQNASLPTEIDIADFLKIPRTKAEWLKKEGSKSMEILRNGERSAYWPKKNVKFKGCNPSENNRTFPGETFFFGEEDVTIKEIPYGTLKPEQVVREVLGWAFFVQHDLKTNIRPICVYPQADGYSLVEHTLSETRVESLFDFNGLITGDLIMKTAAREKTGLKYNLETEVNLDRLNIAWYSYNKALLLVSMNFNGGFRGLLNSNIGNDVIKFEDDKAKELYLCDFDTFRVVEIPGKPDEEFLKRFYLQCFVEAAKSSLPIIDYVWNAEEAVNAYLKISSLYSHYRREFYNQAKNKGWDLSRLEEIENFAVQTQIFKRTVSEIVPSYERLRDLPDREPTYRQHN